MLSRLRNSFRRRKSLTAKSDDGDHCRRPARLARSVSTTSGVNAVVSSKGAIRSSHSTPPVANHVRQAATCSADSQWQKGSHSVLESNRTMFNRQLKCDVTFLVGESRAAVGAHKYQLIARSPVFFRMFCGPMALPGPVHITDVEEDIFRIFLEFLYVDEVALSSGNVTSLHYLGRKYDVEPLVQQCLEFLHARLTPDNACSILEQAHCFDEHELYKTSFEFVAANAQRCLASSALHDLCRECLERILALDELDVSEEAVFSRALSWAEMSLERRGVEVSADTVRGELGAALHLIRFPAMTLTFLQERVLPTRVLTPEEEKAITEYKQRLRASAEPFVSPGRRRRLRRFKRTRRVRCNSRPEDSKWTAAITFCCDQDLALHGLQLLACTRSHQVADVQISVLHRDDLDVYNRMPVYPHDVTLSLELEGVETVDIELPRTLDLLAHQDYTLVIQAVMSTCFAGSDGMAVVRQDDVTFRFRDAQIKLNSTTVSEGQIPCLVYSVR